MTKALFETASLGELSLKNRLVRSATWEGIASPEGALPDEAYTIYEELAKGGVGALQEDLAFTRRMGVTGLPSYLISSGNRTLMFRSFRYEDFLRAVRQVSEK